MVSRRKVISSPHRRPISPLTTLPPTFRLAAESSAIPQPFLKCSAPPAADRSRDEAGKSRRRVRGGMRRRRWYRVPRRPRLPPSTSIAPVAQHRGGNTQLACDPLNGRPLLPSRATASRLNSSVTLCRSSPALSPGLRSRRSTLGRTSGSAPRGHPRRPWLTRLRRP